MLDFKTIHYATMFKPLQVRKPLSLLAGCIALNAYINPVVQLKFLQQLLFPHYHLSCASR